MGPIEMLKAALFGLVEGLTEWLPVSSTGHLLLLDQFVTLDVSPEFWDLFLVVIQLGAILAVPLTLLVRALILESDPAHGWLRWLTGDDDAADRDWRPQQVI